MEIGKLYKNRFDAKERHEKNDIWKVLCGSFFQKFVPQDSTVLDIGAGYCEFINNIRCAVKYAVDLNDDAVNFANSDVRIFNCSSMDLSIFADSLVHVAFMSNFLEHLRSKEEVIRTLSEIHRVLTSDGIIMILQPNIRYLYKEYWDFFDHHIPLSDKSLTEVLQIAGFKIEKVFPKFLPYTTKSKLPQYPFLVKVYLEIPIIWKIMGRQMFILGRKITGAV